MGPVLVVTQNRMGTFASNNFLNTLLDLIVKKLGEIAIFVKMDKIGSNRAKVFNEIVRKSVC